MGEGRVVRPSGRRAHLAAVQRRYQKPDPALKQQWAVCLFGEGTSPAMGMASCARATATGRGQGSLCTTRSLQGHQQQFCRWLKGASGRQKLHF